MRAYVVKPPAPGRRPGFPLWGLAPLFNRARARRSEGPASVALLLASGCREVCPGRPSPARGPPSPSFKGWRCARILRTGLRVGPNRNGPTLRASVEGQPTGRWGHSRKSFRQGSGSHNLERVAHVCPATSSKAAAMCKHTAAANRVWISTSHTYRFWMTAVSVSGASGSKFG